MDSAVSTGKILAIGDNVCDKYLSRKKMYPGGQCVNTCAYAVMNGCEAAFLGKFGTDAVADCVQSTLRELGVDMSHCRHFQGENGFACITLINNERTFIGTNHGGVSRENPYSFRQEDWNYIKGFDLVYTNLNAYIEDDIAEVAALGVPIAFDFSTRWTDDYLAQICPHIKIAVLSCAHLTAEARSTEMAKVANHGVPIVLGTVGEKGSYLLYRGNYYYAQAVYADNVQDTMGAGDAYFATFLIHLLKHGILKKVVQEQTGDYSAQLQLAMEESARFAAKICCMEGAFDCGVPIEGRIVYNRIQ